MAVGEPLTSYVAFVEDEGTISSSDVKSEGESQAVEVENKDFFPPPVSGFTVAPFP